MNSIIIFCASYLYLFVVLLLVVALLKAGKTTDVKVRFLASIVAAGIIALVLSRIAGKLYYDPRPFVTEHVKPLISHVPDNGFPSDHALLTGAITAVTYFYSRRYAVAMLVLTVLVGIARVLAKVHSPLDIAGGWIFGIIGAIAAYYFVNWAVTTDWGKKLQAWTVGLVHRLSGDRI